MPKTEIKGTKRIPKKTQNWIRKQQKKAEERFGEPKPMTNEEAFVLINQIIGYVWDKDHNWRNRNLFRLGEWTKKLIKCQKLK